MATQKRSNSDAAPARASAQRGQSTEASAAAAPLPLHAQGRKTARTAFALAIVILALWVARDFLAPLGWAAILAIALWPLYTRLAPRAGTPPVAAPLLVTVLTALGLFVPIMLATYEIAHEGERIATFLTGLRETGLPVPAWLAQLPIAGDALTEWWHINLADPHKAAAWLQGLDAASLVDWLKPLGGQLLQRFLMVFIALIALFVLLRHGAWVGRRVLDSADRLLGDPGERLASKMIEAVRGTVAGTVLVAVAEGLLIGIAYIAAGVPSPILYMLLTMTFAMLPFGAWIAFSTAALLLVIDGGSGWAAACVFAWGAAVMLVGDHFVWPTLVGGSARLPFLVAIVGIFGGLQAFGLIGLFLGPVVMAALLTIWREWVMAPPQPAS